MKKIIWKIEVPEPPEVLRHCKRCGRKTAFICSGQFRINAQRKQLDIWLIYKCKNCDATWNAAVYSRVSPGALNAGLLERFHRNDEGLVRQYAMDFQFLKGNGAEVCRPSYSILGDNPVPGETVEVEIQSAYPLPVKISTLVRDKLQLSQKSYLRLISEGSLKSVSCQDLRKCRLKKDMVLIFNLKGSEI